MNKHALYIGGFDLPDNNAAAQRVVPIAKILVELGYDITLVGLSADASCCDKLFEICGLKCLNLQYPKTPTQWWKYLTSIRQYTPFINKSTELVVAYNHPSIALSKLLSYNKRRGIKTVADCTEWYVPQGNALFSIIKKWDVNNRMYNVHCKLDGVISISRYLFTFYKERGVNTFLLPPLVDKSDKKWLLPKGIPQKDEISIIYAGSPGGMKDRPDLVVRALEALSIQRTIRFDIVGMSLEQYKKRFGLNEDSSVSEYIHFHGRLPHLEVINMLKQADFQMFFREDNIVTRAGFPTKFAETISSKTIPVTNKTSNIDDYLVDGENGFFIDMTSEETIKKALDRVLSLTRGQINLLKNNIDEDCFDYHRYIGVFNHFISNVRQG